MTQWVASDIAQLAGRKADPHGMAYSPATRVRSEQCYGNTSPGAQRNLWRGVSMVKARGIEAPQAK